MSLVTTREDVAAVLLNTFPATGWRYQMRSSSSGVVLRVQRLWRPLAFVSPQLNRMFNTWITDHEVEADTYSALLEHLCTRPEALETEMIIPRLAQENVCA